MLISLFSAIAGAILVIGTAQAAPVDERSINEAQFTPKRGKGVSALMIKTQVLLDRARFSPGVIDGRDGENLKKALAAFARANGLKEEGKLTKELFDKLAATSRDPVVQTYTIAESDVKGPFVDQIPPKLEDMATLNRLAYTSPLEALAETFHMDEGLLKALNPDKAFEQPGTPIVVARKKSFIVNDIRQSCKPHCSTCSACLRAGGFSKSASTG